MTSSVRTTRRTALAAAVAVALTAGSTVALSGTAAAGTTESAVTTAPLVRGLYQSAYSERNDALWVTVSVGRPPVTDATTGAREAVYGVAVDDEHNTVWVTNTRDDTVAVYSQRTGAHLATLPDVAHAREIVVDERHDTVWASGFGDGSVVAFDSKTFEEKRRITVEGAGPAGLAVNESTGTVYASDLNGDRIIEVSAKSDTPRFVPAGDGPISLALSADGRTAYTADQSAGTVSVVDLAAGAVAKSVATGAGALSVAAVDRGGNVLVVNRTAANVTVVAPRAASVVGTVATGANPNHVEVAGRTAYVVDKSGAGAGGEDQVTRIRVGG
ncbi:YncE family protein [Streptomyces sp. NPDC093591]|uniref:YncE family protein n=1 Tax=Streptomyces sp. NPDC093591 TaxID=3366044 RepID=UPI0038184F4E